MAPSLLDRTQRGVDIGYDPDAVKLGIELRAKIELADRLRGIAAAVVAPTHRRLRTSHGPRLGQTMTARLRSSSPSSKPVHVNHLGDEAILKAERITSTAC